MPTGFDFNVRILTNCGFWKSGHLVCKMRLNGRASTDTWSHANTAWRKNINANKFSLKIHTWYENFIVATNFFNFFSPRIFRSNLKTNKASHKNKSSIVNKARLPFFLLKHLIMLIWTGHISFNECKYFRNFIWR